MAWSIVVNGQDLNGLGFYLKDVDGVHDAVDRSWQMTTLRGRAGAVIQAPVRESGRVLKFSGTLTSTAKTVAGLATNADTIRDLLRSGLVRLVRTDGASNVKFIEGYATTVTLKNIGHPINQTDDTLSFTIQCRDAYYRDQEPTIRHAAVAATRYTLPHGTAPSSPIVRIMGAATNPVLTYRDAGGTAQRTMTFTVTLAATNDWLDIDMRAGKITKWASGVSSNGRALLTSGNPVWAIDPQDGDYVTTQYPTIEVSAGTAMILWHKQWL